MLNSIERLGQLWYADKQIATRLLCSTYAEYYIQKRMRRRTLTPPPWIPKKEEKIVEPIESSTRVLLQQFIKLEEKVNAPIIRANPHMSFKTPLCEMPQKTSPPEWMPESNRVGMLARKIGVLPQWGVDGTRFLCTMLEFPKNLVISAIDPETYYRISMVGRRKAYGRYGARWRITVGAVNGDPTKFTARYRATFERHGRFPVKKHLAAFLVTEDAVVEPGTELHVCHFKVGQYITATGHTIDWGFQGGMHRWGFKGMPARKTTKSHRRIGAVGSKGDARILPGKRMPGHMGYEWRSIPGLEVLRINPEKQVMYVNGTVPGETGDILLIKDCYHGKKKVEYPHFPTFFYEKDFETETKCNDNPESPFVYEDGEFFARRMTMPSIIFTEPEKFKTAKRDKTKAKTAKCFSTSTYHFVMLSFDIYEGIKDVACRDAQDHRDSKSLICFNRRLRAVSAARLPHVVLLGVFEYLSLKDLAQCMRVCKHWWTVLQYPDSFVWKRLAHIIIPDEALNDLCLLSETPSFKDKLRAFCYAWNPNDSSKNNYLRTNGFTVHRNPVAQSTDSVRGKIGVNSGIHAWEFMWEGPLGTVACIGLATKHAALHCQGYVALLGSDDQSWGWNLVDNQLLHNNVQICSYP
ncbi:ribosomal protein L3 [Onchocerca flexuosa]|uniref:Large ribosomal subunit protein uL3m n=1 Tax=Onchocerca flexuosa TaxID=387005 RepID=A0A238C2U4_9BILA|nr:ribosomal protein L3 [Onchocerca flexuosa]